MSFIYGALSAGILWGVYLWFKSFKKSFSGQSSRLFCIFSMILFGLQTGFWIYMIVPVFKLHDGRIFFVLLILCIISLFICISSGKNIKKQNK